MILDATALLLLLNDKTPAPKDAVTKSPITNAHERIVKLVEDLTANGERVIVAAPVLAELLVRAENAASHYVAEFGSSSRFRMVSFDEKAAIEHALVTRQAIEAGDKKAGVTDDWAKVKFDRQIIAIAKASGAHTVCTDDENLRKHAEKQGLKVVGLGDLKLEAQMSLAGLEPDITAAATEESVNELADKEKGDPVVETEPPNSVLTNHTSSSDELITTKQPVNTVTPAGIEPAASTLARSALYPSELRGPQPDYSESVEVKSDGLSAENVEGILGIPSSPSEGR